MKEEFSDYCSTICLPSFPVSSSLVLIEVLCFYMENKIKSILCCAVYVHNIYTHRLLNTALTSNNNRNTCTPALRTEWCCLWGRSEESNSDNHSLRSCWAEKHSRINSRVLLRLKWLHPVLYERISTWFHALCCWHMIDRFFFYSKNEHMYRRLY